MKRFMAVLAAAAAVLVYVPSAGAWTWPVEGPVLRPFVFGSDPYAAGQHRGIDIGAPLGTTVVAAAAGRVSFVGTVPSAGRAVTVQTSAGLSVTYLELGATQVARGADVAEGDPIGTIGAAEHLHFGIRVTADSHGYLDPLAFLPAHPKAPAQADPAETAAPAVALPDPVPEAASAEPIVTEPVAEALTTTPVAEAVAEAEPEPVGQRPDSVPEPAVAQEASADAVSANEPAEVAAEATAPDPVPEPEPAPVRVAAPEPEPAIVQPGPVLEPAVAQEATAGPVAAIKPANVAAEATAPEPVPAAEAMPDSEPVAYSEAVTVAQPDPAAEPAPESVENAGEVEQSTESRVSPGLAATSAADLTGPEPVSQPRPVVVVEAHPVLEPAFAGPIATSDRSETTTPVDVEPEPAAAAVFDPLVERGHEPVRPADVEERADTATLDGAPAELVDAPRVEAVSVGGPHPPLDGSPAEAPEAAETAVFSGDAIPEVGDPAATEWAPAPVLEAGPPLAAALSTAEAPALVGAKHPALAASTPGEEPAPRRRRPIDARTPARAAGHVPARDEAASRGGDPTPGARGGRSLLAAAPVTRPSVVPAQAVQDRKADGVSVGLGPKLLVGLLALTLCRAAAASRRRSRRQALRPVQVRTTRCPLERGRPSRLIHGCARAEPAWPAAGPRPRRIAVPLRPLPRPRRTVLADARS
jgi:hypothetical protein